MKDTPLLGMKREPPPQRPPKWLILTGEQDHVVGEIELDFLQREVRVFKCFGEDDIVIAVFTAQDAGGIRVDGEFPQMKRFDGGSHIVKLRKSVPVQQPIGSAMIVHIFCAVCIENIACERTLMPVHNIFIELPVFISNKSSLNSVDFVRFLATKSQVY